VVSVTYPYGRILGFLDRLNFTSIRRRPVLWDTTVHSVLRVNVSFFLLRAGLFLSLFKSEN
jgi:hypothetical protein